MPQKYMKMRNKFMKEGMSEDMAETKSAKIFNATRKKGTKPVTKRYDNATQTYRKK